MKLKIRNILLLIVICMTVFVIIFLVYKIFTTDNKSSKNTKKVTETTKKESKKETKKVGEAPVITLYGRDDYSIVKGGVYEEMGASAIDKEDGDISKDIKVESGIKLDKAGDYKVVYTVKDKDGNEAKAERKVKVFDVSEKNTSGIPVLMYHYFYDDENGETGEDGNYLAVSDFKKQLNYFKENNFYYPSMKELSLYIDGKLDLPKNSVIITMDDGAESNYRIAYPLAKEYKIPMVWFVVTSWTNVEGDYQKELYNSGYVIYQSHTDDMHTGGCSGMKHGALIQCVDYQKGVSDMKLSKEKLNNGDSMAYPCGDYNDHAKEILKEAGFTLAFSTEFGKVRVGMDKLALPRVRVSDGNSLEYFIGCL